MDAMNKSDVDFADVLKKAQELGYAEADPSADIDGWDIQRKLIISAGVAFGVCLQEEDVPVFGIRNVSAADIRRFQARGLTCKLIASAEKLSDSVAAYVEPKLLGADALEAAVPANFNLISFESEYAGKESFFGQGAGRYPTAYNVVQDLVDIAAGVDRFYTDRFQPAATNNAGALHKYYVRTAAKLPELEALAAEEWDGAVVTLPVSVAQMHSLLQKMLEQDAASFIAGL
jgi:homoserine dehydrogenase